MKELKTQLELQAYVDGQLGPLATWRVERKVASDPEARALIARFEALKRMLAANELERCVPEPREFYWSAIARQIELLQLRQRASGKPARPALWLRRLFVPALATAAIALLIGVAALQFNSSPARSVSRHEVVVAVADPGAVTYRDHASGVTLVWFSYPAQN
ncbi:MAG: hypothetical protein NZ739_01935 [Verrucomicrobiae bacterium]|nr:hypothetical protein [Verrucomicrobiae bacterium]MDW7981080.1 hypothetical protein [Verrucomicrobiales bacterium]